MASEYHSDRFLRACRGQRVDYTPVWLMRQAGRYLPEYRAVRSKVSFREMLGRPELAAEVTLQPVRRFDLDAAIIFSDILAVTEAMGVPFEIVPQQGPVMGRVIRTQADVQSLRSVDPEVDLPHLLEAMRMVVAELGGRIPLIGFSGAPFTLACYVVEGGPSKDFSRMRRLCYEAPDVARSLLARIAESVATLLRAQIDAGAAAIQLFDTWAAVLGPGIYRDFAAPAADRVLRDLADTGVPRIHYAGGTITHLKVLAGLDADVHSIDWRTPLGMARSALGDDVVLQGNLDPCALYSPPARLREEVGRVLDEAAPLRGHIFNLGHGILPDVDPDRVAIVVETVHGRPRREDSGS